MSITNTSSSNRSFSSKSILSVSSASIDAELHDDGTPIGLSRSKINLIDCFTSEMKDDSDSSSECGNDDRVMQVEASLPVCTSSASNPKRAMKLRSRNFKNNGISKTKRTNLVATKTKKTKKTKAKKHKTLGFSYFHDDGHDIVFLPCRTTAEGKNATTTAAKKRGKKNSTKRETRISKTFKC
mmetsp:Transcript_25378/g.31214  ORF Transcript_25378/g.31214 Transcript_25378/m.31214 type:complete len:183 (+) Transcript_25378:91-639(+)|eukprot:CAMPEP_0194373532 /NCGR_PEP_ID=MMETSP0174-20130528/22017_1 /TAXON_ID=216777 /ORGANISM="Proboscia alata, Strain PI-D3" /LENGTH=182 /DNA_ID=CAMNT_0039152691 /DNA_START=75 /DNA_END=623 /DNA_ORIENTATION=-